MSQTVAWSVGTLPAEKTGRKIQPKKTAKKLPQTEKNTIFEPKIKTDFKALGDEYYLFGLGATFEFAKDKYFNFGFSEDLKVNSSADFSFVFGFEIKI